MYLGSNEIVKMYLGSDEIQAKYIGDTKIYEVTSESLPAEWKFVANSASDNYFDTGIIPDGTFSIDGFDKQHLDLDESPSGTRDFTSGDKCILGVGASGNWVLEWNDTDYEGNTADTNRHNHAVSNAGVYTVDGVQQVDAGGAIDQTINDSFVVMARRTGGSITNHADVDFYSLTITSGGQEHIFCVDGVNQNICHTIDGVAQTAIEIQGIVDSSQFVDINAGEVVVPDVPDVYTPTPTATTVGLTDDTILVAQTGAKTPSTGSNITNVDLLGYYYVNSVDNVTFDNVRVKYDGSTGVVAIQGTGTAVTGIVVQNCELDGNGNDWPSGMISGNNYTLSNSYLHGALGDAIAGRYDVTIENNYITDLGKSATSHADGFQISQGSNFVIRGNNFDLEKTDVNKSTSCVFIQSDFGNIDNVLIEDNYFNGGAHTIYANETNGYTVTNVVIRNNFFRRGYDYSVFSTTLASTEYTWENNRWVDTGELIPDPNL